MPQQIHQLFAEQVKQKPTSIALRFHEEVMTYTQLDQRSNHIAHQLKSRGIGKNDIVAVSLDRGFDLIASLLGILKVGAAYLPLDKEYPQERLAFMLNHSQAKILICDHDQFNFENSLNLANSVELVCDQVSEVGELAYVIYTSGSTGDPKGVCLDHSALINLLQHQATENGACSTLQFTPVSFDVHFQEIFSTLCTGGELVLISEQTRLDFIALLETMTKWKIQRIFLPFVALNKLSQTANSEDLFPSTLKFVTTAGEQLRITPSIRRFFKKTGAKLYNHYGPSETHVTTSYELKGSPESWNELPPIGKLVAGNQYILEPHVSGGSELIVGGASVGLGYLNDPDKTAERFFTQDGTRFYRTGDIVKLIDGEFQFVRRADDQIKIRGFRVELGEIEAKVEAILKQSQVTAKVFQQKSGEHYICCYIAGNFDERNLRVELTKILPDYMIPRFFVSMESLPLNPSGKVDKKSLQPPVFSRPHLGTEFRVETSELEKKIVTVWKEVLELDKVGVDDSFFDLGGSSLGALSVLEQINKFTDIKMTIGDLFSLSTVAKQAAFLEKDDVQLSSKKAQTSKDIAIIAMTGQFPGADSVEELHEMLSENRCGLKEFEPKEVHGSHQKLSQEAGYVFVKGEIAGAKNFDHQFFGMTPREAELMDPQQRKFLELSYNALEASGCLLRRADLKIGVFAGSANNTYQHNLRDFEDKVQKYGEFNVMVLNEKDYIATKTAYKLGLRGPAISIHTGCSTSLVAVTQAVDAIRNGHCEIALAGGVAIQGQRNKGHLHQTDSILSKDGYCRAFDQDSTGTNFTDGIGVVVLKSLDQAIADGDYIYSVIKGIGINNDGADKLSFSAPSSLGQQDVIIQAMLDAGITPNEIDFIEAHGTGTPIGDPIELQSLQRAYEKLGIKSDRKIKIGSLKTNIGHLTAAAGVAGLIKVSLSLSKKTLYRNIHFKEPNSKLDIDSTNFSIAAENQKLDKKVLHAGVSSFGIGGTNAHIVLSNFHNDIIKRKDEVFFLSSKSEKVLQQMTEDFDQREIDSTVSRALFSRELKPFRAFRSVGAKKWITAKASLNNKLVFIFPGQGSQYIAMGKELREMDEQFYNLSEYCFDQAAKYLKKDLREVLYQADDDIINNTYYTQPALYIFEYCVAKLLESKGIKADLMLGHSVGEFVAATLSGVFSLESGIKTICKRSELMSAIPGGCMLSVALDEKSLLEILPGSLDIAAINARSSIAVAGDFDSIAQFERDLTSKNIAHKRLHTSHAFHSRMMNPMLAEFGQFIQELELNPPKYSMLSTVTGKLEKDLFASADYWAQHIAKTVRFYPCVKKLVESLEDKNDYLFLEVGPRNTLGTLLKRLDKDLRIVTTSSRDTAKEKENFINSLGSLFVHGVPVDFSALLQGPRNSQLGLTKFRSTEHWLDLNEAQIDEKTIPRKAQMTPSNHESKLKQIIAEIFEDASGIDILEYSDDTCFFEMGMDSLFLTQVALKLKSEFKRDISFRQLTEEYADLKNLTAFYLNNLDLPVEMEKTVEPAAAPVTPPTQSVPLNTLPAQPIAASSDLQGIIQSQLQIMQNQLSLLAGQGLMVQEQVRPQPQEQYSPVKTSEVVKDEREEKTEDHSLKADLNNSKKAFGAIARIETESKEMNSQFVDDFIKDYNRKTMGSKEFTQKSRKDHADPRAVTGFKPEHKEMVYPIVVKKSQDQKLVDIDGNEYIDMLCGFGSNFFGNRNKHIQKRILEQMESGFEIGPQHPLTAEVSALINELTGNERSAFCNTGSEAVLGAMRIARTISGKKKIISFNGSYHGINDEVIIKGSKKGATFPAAPGINKDAVSNMIVLEYSEDESFQKLKEIAAQGDIAAVIVEPVQSRRSDFHPREFLQKVREFTLENDICLIFDEVITGFRISLGGAQEYFGVRADICTYGKIVGGGMPIGVVSGKAKYLDALDGGHWQYGDQSIPKVGVTYFAGTFVRHPLALAAAKGALEVLKDIGNEGLSQLNKKADMWVSDVNNFMQQVGAPLKFANFGALMKPKWNSDYKYSDVFFAYLRYQGLHSYDGFPWFINLAHTDEELEKVKLIIKTTVAKFQNEGLMPGQSIYQEKHLVHSYLPPKQGMILGRDSEGYPQWYEASEGTLR